jgi:hypothetical protein
MKTSNPKHTETMQAMRKAKKKLVRMLTRHAGNINPETFETRTRKFYFFSL